MTRGRPQSTENAIPFYESLGFTRVGAVASYDLPTGAKARHVALSLGVLALSLAFLSSPPTHPLTPHCYQAEAFSSAKTKARMRERMNDVLDAVLTLEASPAPSMRAARSPPARAIDFVVAGAPRLAARQVPVAERRARSGTRSTLVRSATSALREVILASVVDSFFSMASSLHMGKRAC